MNLDQIKQEAESFFGGKPVMVYRDDAVEFAKHCVEIEPVGYIDEFGNFEPAMLPWMQEEPGVAWEAVYKQAQMLQLGEACAAVAEREHSTDAERVYGKEVAELIRNLIKEMLP